MADGGRGAKGGTGTGRARKPYRQQDRSLVTRERLLDAAIECLAELGYAGTTTHAVCERAGLSRGAQLHHFPSKRELLVAAVGHLLHSRIVATRADGSSATTRPRRRGSSTCAWGCSTGACGWRTIGPVDSASRPGQKSVRLECARRSVLVAIGFLGTVLPGAAADAATVCSGTEIIGIDPGLSMAPTAGIMEKAGEQGTEECHGPVDGHRLTGSIRTAHRVMYGYVDPDTCGGLEASGYAVHSLPTADGVVDATRCRTGVFGTFRPSGRIPGC